MRQAGKRQAVELLRAMSNAHVEIKKNLERQMQQPVLDALTRCQETAIELGNLIESSEGEGFITVSYLEEYCELVFQIYDKLSKFNDAHSDNMQNGGTQDGYIRNDGVQIKEMRTGNETFADINPNRVYKNLNKFVIKVENSIKNDINIRKEAIFLPYKASMWDSLESVWQAAEADPDCDAYVIPIPYFDKNPDGSLGQAYYERDKYPDYVPITAYDKFDFEAHRPDMIFIHNPYDYSNHVTTVHPLFYSDNLKKFTDCLVYIPYYATAGGMSEAQAMCPAYANADYIVIQSKRHRKYFDSNLPDEKFLAFGSPKFDSVIHKCQNPPEVPAGWQKKLGVENAGERPLEAGGAETGGVKAAEGHEKKKVYFFNTSLGGMLGNTEAFLKKMEYVFETFEGREDACLVWRPHPLMESTLDSMRKPYRAAWDGLKERFVREEIGILDEMPDIENTIALCDAYIGDSGTSVTSLFGVAGKPLFILNNRIHSLPGEDDWRGEIFRGLYENGQNRWCVTQGNKLYYSRNNDYHYEYVCNLSEYAAGAYYQRAIEFEDNVYICPVVAQDILVLDKKEWLEADGSIKEEMRARADTFARGKGHLAGRGFLKRIELKRCVEQGAAFASAVRVGEYLFFLPGKYPAAVRFHMRTREVRYLAGINDFYICEVGGDKRFGAACAWKNALLVGSPNGSQILKIEADTLQVETMETEMEGGIMGIFPEGDELWLNPYEGTKVACYNPATSETVKYDAWVEGFHCVQRPFGYECDTKPFGKPAVSAEWVVLPPIWGNKFVYINRKSGEAKEWKSPMGVDMQPKNGYYPLVGNGYFIGRTADFLGEGKTADSIGHTAELMFRYNDSIHKRVYDIDFGMRVAERMKEADMAEGTKEADTAEGTKEADMVERTKEFDAAAGKKEFGAADGVGIGAAAWKEVDVVFDVEELRRHEPGFAENSEWMRYCCMENSFNSLKDFIEGNITGNQFDKERQLAAFAEINASVDGDCGGKVYRHVAGKL